MEVILSLLLTLPPAAGPMVAVSLGLGIILVALNFMLAYAMQSPQMVAVAREELAALIFSVIILVFWLGMDSILNAMTSSLLIASLPTSLQGTLSSSSCVGGAGPGCVQGLTTSHITLALATLDILEQKLRSQYVDLYMFEALIGFLSTISFPIGSPIPAVNVISFSLAPFTGLTMLSNAHTVIVEAIGYLVTVVWAKHFILLFSRDAVPLMLFPLGLILRAVPFFRRTGSSIIALAFALYFVLPFALIFSNYLIFDIFKPADFSYNPASSSFFGSDRDQGYFQGQVNNGTSGNQTQHMFEQFNAPSVVSQTYDQSTDACAGNPLIRILCSVRNIVSTAIGVVGGFIGSVWAMWRFMIGMTGDFFFTAFNNPLMPASTASGLFHFLIMEVSIISPFIILVMLTTVIEIIIVVTSFRGVSLAIGGEAEIIGLTKVI
jgi:hypothetical protein